MDELDISADELDDQVAPEVEPSEDENQAQASEPSEEAAEESYVTKSEFLALQEQLAAREAEILRRAKQSSASRSQAIQAEVEKMKTRMDALGISISPEQERIMRQQAEAEITAAELGQASPPGDGRNAGGQQIAEVDPVEALITAAFAEGGADVSPSDPEGDVIAKALRDPHATPVTLQAAALKASLAKSKRLASAQAKSRAQQPTGGRGKRIDKNNIAGITDSDKLYEIAGSEFG